MISCSAAFLSFWTWAHQNFFFKQSKSSSYKKIFLIVAKKIKISTCDYNLHLANQHYSLSLSFLSSLSLFLRVRPLSFAQVLKKCIVLFSSILYRIPFQIFHKLYKIIGRAEWRRILPMCLLKFLNCDCLTPLLLWDMSFMNLTYSWLFFKLCLHFT